MKPSIDPPRQGLWLGAGRPGGDGVWLGTLAEAAQGKPGQVWIATGKEQVIAIVGKRGSGKSFTLGVLIEGLVSGVQSAVGCQQSPRAVLVFDPLDIYWTMRYAVVETANEEANRHYRLALSAGLKDLNIEVQAWVPGLGNRRRSDPDWFHTLVLPVPSLGVEEWELLLGVKMLSDPMGQAFTDVIALVSETGYTIGGQTSGPVLKFDLQDLSAAVLADELTSTYHSETLRALRQRLQSLGRTGLFSAEGTRINDLLGAGSATIVLLNRLPQGQREAVVSLLTRMLIDARSQATFAEKRLALDPELSDEERMSISDELSASVPRTVVVLDEAQSFLSPGPANSTRQLFIRLVKEGRNMGLSAVIATQQPSALDQRILSQVETFVAHQLVTEQDIRAVRENLKSSMPTNVQFGSQTFDDSGLLRQLPPGLCVVSAADMNTAVRRSIIVAVRARATVHGGIEL